MFWKLGWIVESLKYKVEKDIRETIYANKAFKKNRWSLPQLAVVAGSKHFLFTSIFLFLLAIIVSLIIPKIYPAIATYLPLPTNLLSNYRESRNVIFGAQITMLGFIFPLVIAFIGILLQNKSSNEPLWMVYRQTSGFLLLGYSSISLVIFSVCFELIKPYIANQLHTSTAFFVYLWFFLNLILSGWFFWITVEFLVTKNRMRILVQYVINETLAQDIRKKLMVHHSVGASRNGLLKNSAYGAFTVETFSVKKCTHQIVKSHKERKFIKNIFFRPLRLAIFLWSWQKNQIRSHDNVPHIVFPLGVSHYKKDSTILAETNHAPINIWSRLLIRSSVFFSSKNIQESLTIEEILPALFSQIEDSLKDNNSRLFNKSKIDLVMFHNEIQSALHFINDNREIDNWILLTEGEWFGGSYLNIFIKQTIDISRLVTRRIPDDISYFESWCYFYTSIFSNKSIDLPLEAVKSYIHGHFHLWVELMSWMSGFNDDSSSVNQQRDHAIKRFIGSWEHWRHLINKDFDKFEKNNIQIAQIHLEDTSRMIVSATKYENWDAAGWATDVLVYWHDLFSSHQNGYQHYGWHHELITPEIFKLPDNHNLRSGIFHTNPFNEAETISIAIRNYWVDIRCATAAYLMGLSQYKSSEQLKIFVSALLKCKRLEPTGGIGYDLHPISNSQSLLGIFLRQNYFSDYSKRISAHLERLAELQEPEWVSGRVYSSVGNKDHYLTTFFKVMGVGLTSGLFQLSSHWETFLKSNNVSQNELEVTISSLRGLTENLEPLLDYITYQFEIDIIEAERRRSLFVQSINSIVDKLNEEIDNQIANAHVDQARLESFGLMASKDTFTLTKGPIPISLFSHLEYLEDFPEELFNINVTNYRKSDVAEDIEVNRAVNEEEWFNRSVQQQASIIVFEQLNSKLDWKVSNYDNNLELIIEAIKDAKSLKENGLKPILFVGPSNLVELIEASKWNYAEENEMLPFEITAETGQPNSYLCHLDGIEVHHFSFSQRESLLFAVETLKKIKIKRFDTDRYVDANFNTVNDTDLTGTLSLAFGIDSELNDTLACFKYISMDITERE